MSNQEILDLLESTKEYNWRDLEDYEDDEENDPVFSQEAIDLLGQPELVGQYGGSGKGEEYWNVMYFPKVGLHVRQRGFYMSYSGVEFGDYDLEIVQEKEKTIKVWEAI